MSEEQKSLRVNGERLAFVHAASLVRKYRSLYRAAVGWVLVLLTTNAFLLLLLFLR